MKRYLVAYFVLNFCVSAFAFQMRLPLKNPHGKIKFKCEVCHSTASWKITTSKMKFNHERTGFPLIGAHAQVDCRSCHANLAFSKIESSCVSCHTDIHRGELGLKCQSCHNSVSWENKQTVFDEHLRTRFPLLGAHALVDCDACHINQQRNEYKNTPLECRACHIENMKATQDPNHLKAGFTNNCDECHQANSFSWTTTTFKHTLRFPLTGAHAQTNCVDCHENIFAGTPQDCYACHKDNYDNTTQPNHRIFGFLTNCTLCHSTQTWRGAAFDHLQASGFDVQGAHQKLQCNQCHVNNKVSDLPRDCFGCHQNDYRSVANPNHVTGDYPHDCTLCHSNVVWSPAQFDHNTTAFPLTGVHQTVSCSECHKNNIYSGLSSDCYSCHTTDFNNVTDPNHVANSFDHNCTQCHSTTAWTPATFDHNSTSFPLTGAHATVNCVDCHSTGYVNTPSDCYSCHATDFNNVTDPNHVTNSFDHNCTQCHSTTAWTPATFDHNSTSFPLTWAHTKVNCGDCHTGGYNNTPSDCYYCHQQDYKNTNDPNHAAAQFPKACEQCHNTNSWTNTTWDHDGQYFPIYSGAHRGRWTSCSDCHNVSSNYKVFECILCHEHSRTRMDDKHREVRNYQYLSTACYECHPRGRE